MLLIVDDDDAIRETLALVLEDEGYQVRTACDGLHAIESISSELPCVILLDLMMPNMDGWQVFEALQADPKLARVPVCVMTAVPDRAPTGAACVLPKPLRLETLLQAVRAHC